MTTIRRHANHGSWRQTLVNCHSTTIISVVKIPSCNVYWSWKRIIPLSTDVTGFEWTRFFLGEHVAMHAWWRHNCRRMWMMYAHVKHARVKELSNEHISQVWKREYYHTVIVYAQKVIYFQSIKWNMTITSGNTLGCVPTKHDLTVIGLFYWPRGESPNHARLQRGVAEYVITDINLLVHFIFAIDWIGRTWHKDKEQSVKLWGCFSDLHLGGWWGGDHRLDPGSCSIFYLLDAWLLKT